MMKGDTRDYGIASRQRFGKGTFHETHALAEGGATFLRYFEHRRIRVPDFDADPQKFFRHRPGECAGAATKIDDTSVRRQRTSEQLELHRAHGFVVRDDCPDETVVVCD